MKKIMPLAASIALILVAGIFASAGSLAWFNDTDISEGNKLSAGTLWLDAYIGDEPTITMFTVSDAFPGYEKGVDNSQGYGVINLLCKGSRGRMGELDISFSSISNDDNGLIEPESEAGDTTGGPDEGELGQYMEMAVWIDRGHKRDGIFHPGDIGLYPDGTTGSAGPSYYPANSYSGVSWDAADLMGEGGWDCFIISWRIPGSVGDVIQSDSITFTVTLVLEQPEAD